MRKYNIVLILVIAFNTCLAQVQDVYHIKFNFKSDNITANSDREKSYLEVWTNEFYQTIMLQEDVEHHYLYNKQDSNSYIRLFHESKEYLRLDRNPDFDTIKIDFSTNEQKSIAGYKCKLAKIKFENPGDNSSVTCYIWYAKEIPKFFAPTFPYFKNLPGAVLSIEIEGEGMEAFEVVKTTKPTSFFDKPEDYSNMTAEEPEQDNYLGDGRYYYQDNSSELYGLMDTEQKIITPAIYTSIFEFNAGVAIVTNPEGKYAAIDTSGILVSPFKYDYLMYEPNGNQFIFVENSRYGLIKDNKIIIPAEYDALHFFNLGYTICAKDNKCGLIDTDNKLIVPIQYNNIVDYRADLFVVEENQKYSLYEIKTLKMVASNFDFIALPIQDELITVQKDGKYGFMDKKGKLIIPIQYSYASTFYEGVANVALQEDLEDMHTINTSGKKVE
ncbi:WG repeat-containing protein [Sphingobacterium bovistauri]|uniref:WG repeat-containing protein n=1 Tax=Sphingobacterium bovistauri TaxID=2781959 RepID=A0ABS7Z802_9SPHI|nr:WG repeat-containing protein [Sphingobacterium bovistauri]MCA5005079.1 WG repeat-containing protein [Sphingobacterium bovistauri]